MINFIFNWCVGLLDFLAAILGISYNAINVWIFCVIWPIFTLWLIWLVLKQRKRLKQLTESD